MDKGLIFPVQQCTDATLEPSSKVPWFANRVDFLPSVPPLPEKLTSPVWISGSLAHVLGVRMYAMEHAQRLVVPALQPRTMSVTMMKDLLDEDFDWGEGARCWDKATRCVIYECAQPMQEGLQMQES